MRKFGVTKTIKQKVATVMCVNTETGEVYNDDFLIKRYDEDLDKLLYRLQKIHNTPTKRLVKILDVNVTAIKYGMTVEDFIEKAVRLDNTDEADVTDVNEN